MELQADGRTQHVCVCVCVRPWRTREQAHLLQKILRPVKVLLLWGQWGAAAAGGNSGWDDEDVAEVEARVPSPPSGCCCSSLGC